MENVVHWVLNLPAWVWITIIAHFVVLGTVAYLILLERKVASWVQDRLGPNRVGLGFGIIPWLKDKKMGGLGQPLADGLKFILKEDYQAKGVDPVLFTLAPLVMITVVIISIAVLPMGGIRQKTELRTETRTFELAGGPHDILSVQPILNQLPPGSKVIGLQIEDVPPKQLPGIPHQRYLVTYTYPATVRYPFQIADLNIGVLYVLAVLSLAVYGVVIGGWASNNKYSFLGGLRATANMISYEIPLGLAVLAIVVMFGTLNLETIVQQQARYWAGWIPAWNCFSQPLAFLMFLVCIHAEANRAPFDLAEAEQELVGGYHTEYSSMRFALFFLAEYAGMITTSAVCVALFFGGWHIPWIDKLPFMTRVLPDPNNPSVTTSLVLCIVRAFVVFVKTLIVIFVFMWVRWSLPRFRFDQLMMLAWRALIPMSLALLVMTAIVVYLLPPAEGSPMMVNGWTALGLLIGNGVVLMLTMGVSQLLPAPPPTNRKMVVPGSRFHRTPLPAGTMSNTGGNGSVPRATGSPVVAG
ncbi:MAG TPA: complex I subunit 1 family protein [Tepidisphaeraceae bacterium]